MQSTSLMNTMLAWLKGVATMILDLFDLAGKKAFSPLEYLMDHWLALLIILIIAGIIIDIIVWLVRWRPHWVWFRKKRIVIDDDDYFRGEELCDVNLYDSSLFDTDEPSPRRKRKKSKEPESDFFKATYKRKDVYGVDENDDIFDTGDIKVRKKRSGRN